MTKISTWMPLYIGDYLSDTMHLSAQEHGAYLLLIMNYWRNGPLPDDDKALASISKVERREWMREVGPVVRQFFITQDGKLHHKRIDIELEAARENSHKKRLAAEARWAKRNTGGDPPAGPNGDARAYADASAEDPIRICPSPSPSPSKVEKEDPEAALPLVVPAPEPSSATAILWREGLPIIQHLTGKSDAGCRSLLGKMLGNMRDDAPKVLLILQQARARDPMPDPVAWLIKATQNHGQEPGNRYGRAKPSGVAAAKRLEEMARGYLTLEAEEQKWPN